MKKMRRIPDITMILSSRQLKIYSPLKLLVRFRVLSGDSFDAGDADNL